MKQLKYFVMVVGCLVLMGCSGKKATKSVSARTSLPNGFTNKVIAHRGAFKNTGVPENSLASLKEAIKLGCGGSEFDIHLTADNIPVIHHDHDLQGLNIETSKYDELAQRKLPNGESIPTLEAYLEAGSKQYTTMLVAEIKPSKVSKERSLALAERVVQMVERMKLSERVVYISFDYDILKKVKQLSPGSPLQYLGGDIGAAQLKADGIDVDYHYSVFQRDPEWIKNARSLGIVVNAWTVNSEAVMDSLLAQQIDFITTNEPELLLRKLRN